jgi:hypothetical protein
VGKKKFGVRIYMQPSPKQIMTNQQQLENVEHFNYLGSMTANDGTCTRKIKSRIAMEKASLIKKTFHQQIALKFKEGISKFLHLEHSFAWC